MPRSEAAQIPQYRHDHQYRPGYRPMGGGPPVRKKNQFICYNMIIFFIRVTIQIIDRQ